MKSKTTTPDKIKIPRSVRSQQVKEKIYQSAMELLKTHGYEYVTVNNICTNAEVSVGSFYHFYKNKDDLFAYYLSVGYEKFQAQYIHTLTDDFIGNLYTIYELYTLFCESQGLDFVKNYYNPYNKALDINASAPENENRYPIHRSTLEELAKAQENGFLSEESQIHTIADDLCVLEKGFVFEWALKDGNFNCTEAFYRFMWRYLYSNLTEKYFHTFCDNNPNGQYTRYQQQKTLQDLSKISADDNEALA